MYKLLLNGRMPDDITDELSKQFEIICPKGDEDFTDEEMLARIEDADALLCLWLRKVRPEWIDAAKKLKVIGNVAVGYDNIDVSYAAKKGVAVVNTPVAVQEATAEMAIGLMLSIARGITQYHTELKQSLRCGVPFFFDRGMLLYKKTFGIVGCGRVGRAVARKAQGLGMEVVYYDPYRLREEDEKALALTYMPYMKETHHLIDESAFSRMKRSAYFINTARGPIVDEAALIKALQNKVIAGAGLDVFEFEPKVSEGFADIDNVVIVPHVGTMLLEVRYAMVRESASGILEVLNGGTPKNIVPVLR